MNMYKVHGRIGQGAHGVVMKALDTRTDREVALKRINYKRPSESIPKNVLREILCLQIVDHEFVVDLLEVFTHSLGVVLVFDFMPAGLAEIIHDDENILNESQLKAYMLMLLKGLAYIHNLNIMHRDLKPANLLIDKNGILKIADFGLGRLYCPNTPVAYSHQVATRWYRAPELLYSGRFYNEGVDLWAVGCIFAEMINRAPLFPGGNDIEQLAIVHYILGTPTEETWPDMTSLPDFNKIAFPHSAGTPFTTLIPDSSPHIVNLVSRWLSYNSALRPPAKEAIFDRYFLSSPMPCPLSELPKPAPDRRNVITRSRNTLDSSMCDMYADLKELVLDDILFPLSSFVSIDSGEITGINPYSECSSKALMNEGTNHFKTGWHKSKSSGSMRTKQNQKKLKCRKSRSVRSLPSFEYGEETFMRRNDDASWGDSSE